ncbi:zinc finger, CCHC-type, retrotransposon gag domain protein [Tanacetum coccineum]
MPPRRNRRNNGADPAFAAAIEQAVATLVPTFTTQITDEIRQNENNGNNGNRRNGRRRVEAENWIAHIEKIFKVLGCDDRFKSRLATYKLEGDAHSWLRAYKQAKGGDAFVTTLAWKDFRDIFFLRYFPYSEKEKYEREYKSIRQLDGETSTDFMKRFLSLTGFLRAKEGTQEERAKNFKWGLSDFILDKIINTEFTDIAQVANAARNIEILRDRLGQEGNNKRNRDGHRIRPSEPLAHGPDQRAYDRRDSDRYGYSDIHSNNDRRDMHGNNDRRDRHDNKRQREYSDYTSSTPCNLCGKLHPGKACHKATGACFTCGQVGHLAKDYKKGSTSNGGNGNNKQPATNGRVFALTTDQNLEMSDFDSILGMDWLT